MKLTIYRHPITVEPGDEQEVVAFENLSQEQYDMLLRVVDDTVFYNWSE